MAEEENKVNVPENGETVPKTPKTDTKTEVSKTTPDSSVSTKTGEIKVPTIEEREAEHSDLTKLVNQYEEMGAKMTTPITVDADKIKINPFDDTKEQEQVEHDQQTEFEWTKHYMDNQVLSASSALRINSVAALGSQVKMNYEVLMPVQHQLQQAQDHYQYLNDQVNNSRQLAQIALRQQQAQAVVSVQQLNQKLSLELDESRQNMETQITTMLGVYNSYESSLNDLVLSKNSLKNQQKIIDNKKQSSHKSWWSGIMQSLPGIMMGTLAIGKGLGLAGKIGGIGAKLATVAESEEVGAVKSGFAGIGSSILKGKAVSKSIGGLLGGAISLGMFMM